MIIDAKWYDDETALAAVKDLYINDKNVRIIVLSAAYRTAKRFVENLSKSINTTFVYSQDRSYIKDTNITGMSIGFDGSKIRGLRANHIVLIHKESMNKEVLSMVITGFLACSDNPIRTIKELKIKELK